MNIIKSKKKNEIKVLLISINNTWRYSNIGVDQIAGYLRKKDYSIDILYSHKGVQFENVKNSLQLKYDVYGLSLNSFNYQCCLKTIDYIKKSRPDSLIVFGGGFCTRYYREIYQKTKNVDFIILGDGEIPMEKLLECLINDNFSSLDKSYIVTKNDYDGKMPYCNKKIEYFPAYDYYINEKKMKNARKEYCIQTKNNICTGKCSFCTERKGNIAYKDISHIVEEVNYVATAFGIKKFFFTDDNIFDPNNEFSKQRISHFCSEIQKLPLNLVFKCYTKANSLKNSEEDNKLLKQMSETGFKTFFVGIEAGNEQDLRLYNKLTTVQQNEDIVLLLKKHGIKPQIGFINFNPYSTIDTLRQNYNFLMNIEMDNLFMYICSYLRVFKYTDIYTKMQSDKLLFKKYDYLDDKSLYKFYNKNTKKIFSFAYKYMHSRIRNLDMELDWLFAFYVECKKINPAANKFEVEFNALHEEQFNKIKIFFYFLFVKNDLKWCKENVNEFLCFFENLQPLFLEIHRELLSYYLI
jgi:radical SAM superfamily enzyme YgiQ (UPF0313 family)